MGSRYGCICGKTLQQMCKTGLRNAPAPEVAIADLDNILSQK